MISDKSVESLLLKACQKPTFGTGESIKKILQHKDFEMRVGQFIEIALAPDESQTPRLFGFSDKAVVDILDTGKNRGLDLLKIVDPTSGRNFFIHVAHLGNMDLLRKLIQMFPQTFLSIGQEIIAEFLNQGHPQYDVLALAKEFEKRGGKFDIYHNLWLQIVQGNKPGEDFKQSFDSLNIQSKQALYDAAYIYNNSYIYEPSELPIKPDQYSINLMWINKEKIPDSQEFLFDNKDEFEKKFIEPVSKWAKAHPESVINIWVDIEMATSDAIERSKKALLNALEGTSHGKINFRDVRSLDIVRSNSEVFNEQMFIYFRADLLRAIVADDTLRKKETKFCVYGDLDMEPLS